MLAPTRDRDAIAWISRAASSNRFELSSHAVERMGERRILMSEVMSALQRPRRVEPYPDMPRHGGTVWRVFGRRVGRDDGIAIGVEAYVNQGYRALVICTVMLEGRE